MVLEHEEAARRASHAARDGEALAFRRMSEADLPFIMPVERRCYDFPWSEGIFRDCIRSGYYCCLLLDRGAILGYSIMAVAAGEAHVLNICIDRNEQGRGLGRALLEHLIGKAREADAVRMLLEVRVSNTAAKTLYESAGFTEIGMRRNYYPGRRSREDAIVLVKLLGREW